MKAQIIDILNLPQDRWDRPDTFCGRIVHIIDKGKICFYKVADQSGEIQAVANFKNRYKVGDHVSITGKLQYCFSRIEILVDSIELVSAPNAPLANQIFFNQTRMENLRARSLAMRAINSYFQSMNFLQVHSPSIVSDWVVGQTGAFDTEFYGQKANLTISNMMYHEIMMINGFSRIYEIAKIFRQEHPSSVKRLAEFTIIDIGLAYENASVMMQVVEGMIAAIFRELRRNGIVGLDEYISFEAITYQELVEKAGCPHFSGSQFPKIIREYLHETYKSFVWVTGFPDSKRPFFVKSDEVGNCSDYQLWYRGSTYLAAGGERETNLERIRRKIRIEGKDDTRYDDILRYFETGVPPMCGIGMGIERFLGTVIDGSTVADYVAFPRYQGHMTP